MTENKYNIVPSDDGTRTLYSSEFSEAMHSDSGAYTEAREMHIIPSGVLDACTPRVAVLDLGFGLGYNVLALLYELQKKDLPVFADIVSLEKSHEYVDHLLSIHFTDEKEPVYDVIKNAFITGSVSTDRFSLKFIMGDARESIRKLRPHYFDVVFHDAFSPSKNPELWTVDFFNHLREVMKPSARLTTYSSAPHVRLAMIEAGFAISRGPSVGRKKEGTIATLDQTVSSFSIEEIAALRDNVKATPYRDRDLGDNRNVILERRISEMKEKRALIKANHQAHQE